MNPATTRSRDHRRVNLPARTWPSFVAVVHPLVPFVRHFQSLLLALFSSMLNTADINSKLKSYPTF